MPANMVCFTSLIILLWKAKQYRKQNTQKDRRTRERNTLTSHAWDYRNKTKWTVGNVWAKKNFEWQHSWKKRIQLKFRSSRSGFPSTVAQNETMLPASYQTTFLYRYHLNAQRTLCTLLNIGVTLLWETSAAVQLAMRWCSKFFLNFSLRFSVRLSI